MNTDNNNAQEPLSQSLEKTRAVLNAVLATHPDVLSWAPYREAEVLYAQALQQFIAGNPAKGESLAEAASVKALEARHCVEAHANHTKESMIRLLEESSGKIGKLRTTYRIVQDGLPQYRISRCGYFFHQAQESLNKALGAFFSNEFSQSEGYLEEVKQKLDTLEKLLQKDNGRSKST